MTFVPCTPWLPTFSMGPVFRPETPGQEHGGSRMVPGQNAERPSQALELRPHGAPHAAIYSVVPGAVAHSATVRPEGRKESRQRPSDLSVARQSGGRR